MMHTHQQILSKFDAMEQKRAHLFTKLEQTEEAVKNFSPAEGKWTVNQILLHLYFSERGVWKVISRSLEKQPAKKITWLNHLKYWFLKAFLQSNFKVKAPEQVSNIPNDVQFDEIKQKWEINRRDWKALIEQYPTEYIEKYVFKHPLSGDMNIGMTLGFMDVHFERHQHQIERILKAEW